MEENRDEWNTARQVESDVYLILALDGMLLLVAQCNFNSGSYVCCSRKLRI